MARSQSISKRGDSEDTVDVAPSGSASGSASSPKPRIAKTVSAASIAATTGSKKPKVRTVGDNDDECPICAAIPKEQRKKTTRKEDSWLSCDQCQRWFHWEGCVKKEAPLKTRVDSFEEWYCNDCLLKSLQETDRKGDSLSIKLKDTNRKSSRKKADVKYASSPAKPISNPWHAIAESRPLTNTTFRVMEARELTLEWLESDPRAFTEPIFIEKPEGLDMQVLPADIKISEIARLVGEDKPIDVIDVASQSGLSNWTLGKWAEYYEDPAREKIRNVISLELSSSPIRDRIVSPKLVRDIDWVENYWPAEFVKEGVYPQVSRYCLMSPGQSWTDWHVDFSASSVFYHILRGAKTFYFISPSASNLQKYEIWSGSNQQQGTWLGDMCDRVYKVELHAGNTMIIPAGWIHCVYTPTDALVVGGNWVCSYSIPTQLRVYQIELNTKVPKKFRFPYFVSMLWYVGWHYHNVLLAPGQIDLKTGRQTCKRVLTGLKALSAFLIEQAYRISDAAKVTSERRRVAKENIPWQLFDDPAQVAKDLQEMVYAALREEVPKLPADGVPRFDAQDWLEEDVPYALPGSKGAAAGLKRKASASGSPVVMSGLPVAKTAKFKHFANGAGQQDRKPSISSPAANGNTPSHKTQIPEQVEKKNIAPVTSIKIESRARPRPPVIHLDDEAGIIPSPTALDAKDDMQEVEVKTTIGQNTVKKILPGDLEGSWIVETRRVVTTIERVYYPPLPPKKEEEAEPEDAKMEVDEDQIEEDLQTAEVVGETRETVTMTDTAVGEAAEPGVINFPKEEISRMLDLAQFDAESPATEGLEQHAAAA